MPSAYSKYPYYRVYQYINGRMVSVNKYYYPDTASCHKVIARETMSGQYVIAIFTADQISEIIHLETKS